MNTVVISQERYEELIRAELKLHLVRDVASRDNSNYGYSQPTANTIECILGIEGDSEE